jgi:hypothetical protein
MQSPLNPMAGDVPATDSSVFLTIAKGMLSGQLPYVDFFDHKGPLLYFIDALGLLIGGYTGVWLIELLFMFISVLFAYKTARFFGGKSIAFLGTGFSFVVLGSFFEGGNLTEEYVLPFIFISLYIFTKYFFIRAKFTKTELTVLGVCFGASLMLRPNMFAVWAAFCMVIFFRKLWKKEYKLIGQYILFFLIGVLFVLLPIVLYLKITGSFDECIDQFIVFNRMYASLSTNSVLIRIQFFARNFMWGIGHASLPVIIAIIWLLKRPRRAKYEFHIAYALSLVFSLLFIALSRIRCPHYCMILVPLYVPALTYCIKKLLLLFSLSKQYIVKYGVTILLACIFFSDSILFSLLRTGWNLRTEEKEYFINMGKFINDNTDADDTVSVFGNQCAVYLYTERNTASKFIYQYPLAEVDEAIGTKYVADIQKAKPALFIIPKVIFFSEETDRAIMKSEMGRLIFQKINEDYYECFNFDKHTIFKRK